jgi:hypothetical protein
MEGNRYRIDDQSAAASVLLGDVPNYASQEGFEIGNGDPR